MVVFLLDDDKYNQNTIDFVDFLQNDMKVSLEVIVYVFRLNTNRRVYMELMKRRCRCITARIKSTLDLGAVAQQRIPENMFHFKPGNTQSFSYQSGVMNIRQEKKQPEEQSISCSEMCKNVIEIEKPKEKEKEKENQEDSWPAVHHSVLKTRKIITKQPSEVFNAWKEQESQKTLQRHFQKENESTYILKEDMPSLEQNEKEYEKTITLYEKNSSDEQSEHFSPRSADEETLVLTIKDGYTLSMDFPDLEAIVLLDNLGLIWQGLIRMLRNYSPELDLYEILKSCVKMLKTEMYYRECDSFYETTLDKLSDQILEISNDLKRTRYGFVVRTDYPQWMEYPSRIADILFRLIALVLVKLQTRISPEVKNTISQELLSLLDSHLQHYSLPCSHNPKRQCQSVKLFQHFRNCPLPKGEKEMAYFCCGLTNENQSTLVIPKGVKK